MTGNAQEYVPWETALGKDLDISIEALIDDWEGFRVILRDHGSQRMIRVSFDTHVAYQCRDESDIIGEATRSGGVKDSSFYRVLNSEFVSRFARDSARASIAPQLMHFLIATPIDCVDVLAMSPPRIEYLSDVVRRRAREALTMEASDSRD